MCGNSSFQSLNEAMHKIVVGIAGDAFVAPAEIFRIGEALDIVCAHVKNHGKRLHRGNTANQRIKRKLSDGNAKSADTLISNAKDALAVGNHA